MEAWALFFTAISALGAAAAACVMYFQAKSAIKESREAETLRNQLLKAENDLRAVNNKILINQMYNDFNKMVIEGDEGLRTIVGKRNFEGLEPEMVRRVYLMFSAINVCELAWRMMKIGDIPSDQVEAMLGDQAAVVKKDKEAAKHALTGRGYSQDFLDAFWPRVFKDEPVPRAGVGQFISSPGD